MNCTDFTIRLEQACEAPADPAWTELEGHAATCPACAAVLQGVHLTNRAIAEWSRAAFEIDLTGPVLRAWSAGDEARLEVECGAPVSNALPAGAAPRLNPETVTCSRARGEESGVPAGSLRRRTGRWRTGRRSWVLAALALACVAGLAQHMISTLGPPEHAPDTVAGLSPRIAHEPTDSRPLARDRAATSAPTPLHVPAPATSPAGDVVHVDALLESATAAYWDLARQTVRPLNEVASLVTSPESNEPHEPGLREISSVPFLDLGPKLQPVGERLGNAFDLLWDWTAVREPAT